MSQDITCPHCHLTYSDDNPPKKLVNCSHNICLKCLQELILCPVDRTRIQLRRFTLEAFKTNEALLQLATQRASPKKSSKSHHSSKKYTPHETGSNRHQKSKSSRKISHIEKTEKEITISDFEERKQEKVQCQQPTTNELQHYVSQSIVQRASPCKQSPKKQSISYQMCLLHSKKADLICVEDKAVICAGCGLFGEHKLHTIIPYDTFLNQYSTLAEDCFKSYQQLQNRFEKMNVELIEQQVTQVLADKRGRQIKKIKTFIRNLSDLIKNLEKELVSNLDVMISYKKDKLMESMCFSELAIKRDQYMSQVEGMTEGLECLFNLDHIEDYIPFIDPNSQKSYIQEQGEYLIREIDNYCKTVQQRIQVQSSEFNYTFKDVDLQVLRPFYEINSNDSKAANQLIQQRKKQSKDKAANQYRSKPYTPSRGKNCKDTTIVLNSATKKVSPIKHPKQDNLLLELNSKSNSPEHKDKNLSPIHPLSTYENFEPISHSMGTEFFLKVAQPPKPEQRTSRPKANTSLYPPRASKSKLVQNSENFMGESSARLRSKPKSNNNSSNHMTERELLNVLNEKSDNKKRKKIDLPEKYSKVYEDLQKDRLDVVDLGGAFLGDSKVLAISQLFPTSRGKIKQVKLMNNKLSDDVFPDLISRCRTIHSLNLSYNQFTEKSLEWLLQEAAYLGELKNITLSNNKIVLRSNRDKMEELKRRGINVSL